MAGRDQDCVVCAVVAHGNVNELVVARDSVYSFRKIYEHFNSKMLPILAGKPKILFRSVRDELD